MPVEHCMIGAPLGRTLAESIVLFGEEAINVEIEVGGKLEVCVLVFLQGVIENCTKQKWICRNYQE